MTHVTCPAPMPESGTRCLSPREAQQRARAMACLRERNSVQCQGQVYVNVYFDGTGNNRDWHEPGTAGTQIALNSHSNVARLYDARIDDPSAGFFATYIPGVGTPFPEIGDEGGTRGNAFGGYGADRINWGIVQIYNAMHRYLTDANLLENAESRTVVGNMSSLIMQAGFENAMRRTILRTWESRLAAVIRGHQRKLTQVNVAVFGFSRGAAQARAFAHWLFEIAKGSDGGYRLAGVPLRLYFMGIFDTVASVGSTAAVPGAEGKMAWADEKQMAIHPAVEQCVHFFALHEQRANFPLDATRAGKQVSYPGMHSDVGGGYSPGSQGKAMPAWGASPQLSQIPLVDMHFEAIKAGVPLMTIQEIKAKPALARAFHVDPKLARAYNAWQAQHGLPKSGSVSRLARAHVRQSMQWRGLRTSKAGWLLEQPFFKRADQAGRRDLTEAQTRLARHAQGLYQAEQYSQRMSRALAEGAVGPYMSAPAVSPQGTQLTPEQAEMFGPFKEGHSGGVLPPPACVILFDDYIHDSLAGFRMPKGSGIQELALTVALGGYFRYRKVFAV